jgi:hypothetical protein
MPFMVGGVLKKGNGQPAPAGKEVALGSGTGGGFTKQYSTTTGSYGAFMIPNVNAGVYTIRIKGNCFGCSPSSVTVNGNKLGLQITASCL